MDSTTQTLAILIFLLTMVVSIVVTQFLRRRRAFITLRELPAYALLPLRIGEAIEASRPIHMSFGSSGLGGENTLLTLAGAELFYQVARRAAISPTAPIITLSDPSTLAVAQDTLRRAYHAANFPERFRATSARWYPAGPRSLVFAAALTGMLGDDDVSAHVLVGSFGTELALIAGAAARRGQPVIAASDQLQGQAVAFAMSESALIGEEIFAAGAYLGESNSQVASIFALDVLRWLLILFILVPTLLTVVSEITRRSASGG
ncbi:MAG: hypothetical protein H7175_23520 [Burkholderiales bacterium]|nr:hypothetical protein [Anaerolineae bacterium]